MEIRQILADIPLMQLDAQGERPLTGRLSIHLRAVPQYVHEYMYRMARQKYTIDSRPNPRPRRGFRHAPGEEIPAKRQREETTEAASLSGGLCHTNCVQPSAGGRMR
jgi:hypothetical protein